MDKKAKFQEVVDLLQERVSTFSNDLYNGKYSPGDREEAAIKLDKSSLIGSLLTTLFDNTSHVRAMDLKESNFTRVNERNVRVMLPPYYLLSFPYFTLFFF